MYRALYSMAFNPFDKNRQSTRDRFESEDFRQMTARLGHLVSTRGIGLFTASPGIGKTFCLRCFMDSLNPNLHLPASVTVISVSFGSTACVRLISSPHTVQYTTTS